MMINDEEAVNTKSATDLSCPSSPGPYRRHGHHAHSSQQQQQQHQTQQLQQSPSKQHPRRQHYNGTSVASSKTTHLWVKVVKLTSITSVGLYLLVIIRGFHLLQEKQSDSSIRKPILTTEPVAGLADTWHRYTSQSEYHRLQQEANRLEEEDAQRHLQAKQIVNERAQQRRLRTSPPTDPSDQEEHARAYQFLATDLSKTPQPDTNSNNIPADPSTLCGTHAQTAALAHPNSYLTRDTLTPSSTVLITGILSPLGFHLALKLQQQCNVQVILGIDHMYPNTALHRLHLSKRIMVLSKAVPKLIKEPILLPFLGLDPRSKSSKKKSAQTPLYGTDEVNLLQQYKPTHIVHLSSYHLHSYHDSAGITQQWHNQECPYTSDMRNPPLYEIRQGSASMEHVLASIASSGNETSRPHFLYASSLGVHSLPFGPSSSSSSSSSKVQDKIEQTKKQNQEWGQNTNTASSSTDTPLNEQEYLHSSLRLVDETLAKSYHALHNVYSVGMRFGEVYGPWGNSQEDLYKLAEEAVTHWTHDDNSKKQSLLESTQAGELLTKGSNRNTNYLYVQDAVDSIIAAMQYRKEEEKPVVFDVSSSEMSSTLATAAGIMEDYRVNDGDVIEKKRNRHGRMIDVGEQQIEEDAMNEESSLEMLDSEWMVPSSALMSMSAKKTQEYLSWKSSTSLSEGIMKLLAWHLDKALPYGPPPSKSRTKQEEIHAKAISPTTETGNDFLIRQKAPICAFDDLLCLQGAHTFPCVSECAAVSSSSCQPSVFDPIVDLVMDVTEGCDVLVMTQILGHDVEDLKVPVEFVEETHESYLPCNVAFVPKESKVVKKVIGKVPSAALKQFEIEDEEEGKNKDVIISEDKLEKLNGRLVHQGWIIVWLDNAMEPLSHADKNLLKLSPGRFLSPSVKFVLYLEENFNTSPTVEDILFLVSRMKKKAKEETTKQYKDSNSIMHTYHLPAEPARRAALLVAPMKMKMSDDEPEKPIDKSHHTTLYEATKYMIYEMGGDPNKKEKGPSPTRQQRMFYERIISVVNRPDVRSTFEPVHRYDVKDFIRSRWVVHDMTLELARHLRCEWYEEHSRWGGDLDQLTFAHVMASRELTRKFVMDEPDDHILAAMQNHPEVEDLSDAHEWHALLYEGEAAEYEHAHYQVKKVPVVGAGAENDDEEEEEEMEMEKEMEETPQSRHDKNVGLYTRIMSDGVMHEERKAWMSWRRKKMQQKGHKK